MAHLHSYPKVYAIGHAGVAELFDGDVLVEEKIDGSQFSFAKVAGEISMRSKGADIIPGSHDSGMFSAAVNSVEEMKEFLHEGWTYRCEYLQKPKHNVMAYPRIPKRHLILFDINTGDEIYMSRADKVAEAERIGLEYVPVMHFGKVDTPEKLYALLERESVLGGPLEGIVVKNYSRFGRDKKVLMGKFVREEFKEAHNKEWKADNPSLGDVIDRIIATLRSEARWEKSVQHLRDVGELEHSPRDIGKLIKEVQRDVREEEKDFIQQKLYEYAMPRILRAASAGMPEWYKRRLLESAFEKKDLTAQ